MNKERFKEIMSDEEMGGSKLFEPGCNVLKGLNIIAKYLPNSGVKWVNYEVLYAVEIEKIVEAGITEEDAIELRYQNWMIDSNHEYLSCFV